ncbi:MAG: hypothetical protein HQM15_04255 [Deltaproteobacteria bacterium]|nr:hypothetical protein [Deltaproteobacteria bacterium]
MVDRIKGTAQPPLPPSINPNEAAPQKAISLAPNAASSRIQQELKKSIDDIFNYKNAPFSGMKLFSDGIVFPGNILDTKDEKNDPKYMRLLAAMYGLAEYERYFNEGQEDDEWKLGKIKAQEERKKEEDKNEKKQRRD